MALRAATFDDFRRAPAGCYFAGATFAHFCATDDYWGVILWGRPSSDDIALLVRSLHLELAETASRHRSVVDTRRLDSVDVTAFAVLDDYVRTHTTELGAKVDRLALLRPEGMTGAVVAGFFEVLPRPYPVEVFASGEDAMAWLEVETPASLLDLIFEQAAGAPPIVAALRTVLEANLADVAVASAAKELGMSERTLQRRIRQANTTFADELNAARVRTAKRLLADSDEPVTRIALDVGCATPQHFSTLFRKATGLTPSAWRKQAGASDP